MKPWPTVRRSPIGAEENSPAFQRRVNAINIFPSPAGTAEILDAAGMAMRGFCRPSGTRFPLARIPAVETAGYCRASLRDDGNVAQPSRRRVRAASRGAKEHRAWTPDEPAGEDACATTEGGVR